MQPRFRLHQIHALTDIGCMAIDIKDVKGAGAAAVESVESAELSKSMPFDISLADVEGAMKRSGAAADLGEKLAQCHRDHRTVDDVEDLIRRASPGGKIDGDQAVVMAYYAQKHREVFSPRAYKALTKFFNKVDWNALMADLRRFIEDLRAKEAEHKKAEQIKQDRLKDDIKRDDAKRQLVKDNGTKADRQRELKKTESQKAEHRERIREASPGDLDEELTASGRLPLSDVERTKLGLMKKGFANKE